MSLGLLRKMHITIQIKYISSRPISLVSNKLCFRPLMLTRFDTKVGQSCSLDIDYSTITITPLPAH